MLRFKLFQAGLPLRVDCLIPPRVCHLQMEVISGGIYLFLPIGVLLFAKFNKLHKSAKKGLMQK